jgi:hypothetical protein
MHAGARRTARGRGFAAAFGRSQRGFEPRRPRFFGGGEAGTAGGTKQMAALTSPAARRANRHDYRRIWRSIPRETGPREPVNITNAASRSTDPGLEPGSGAAPNRGRRPGAPAPSFQRAHESLDQGIETAFMSKFSLPERHLLLRQAYLFSIAEAPRMCHCREADDEVRQPRFAQDSNFASTY